MYILQLLGQLVDAEVELPSGCWPEVGHILLNGLACRLVVAKKVGS